MKGLSSFDVTRLGLAGMCRGKWARATKEEVQDAVDQGIPYCYRFRVPAVRARPCLSPPLTSFSLANCQ